jgi:DNA-directed RNA polymerase specialized sigma24 family protein
MAAQVRGRELVEEDALAALHERIDRESAARALHWELRLLPAGERAMLELVALDGLPIRGAGQALGIGAVAARMRLHRAGSSMQRGDHSLRIADRDPPIYTASDEIGSPPLVMILMLMRS